MTIKRKPPRRRSNSTKSKALVQCEETALAAQHKEAVALKQRVQNADLKLMLRGHALQASTIVDRAAQAEGSLLSFITSGKSRETSVLTQMIRQIEAVRSGALRDFERVAKTIEELENPTPRVTVYANVPRKQKARVVGLDTRGQIERK